MGKHSHEEKATVLSGTFEHVIYSPKGDLEGLLVTVDNKPIQYQVEPQLAETCKSLKPKQVVYLEATKSPPSPKGKGVHAIYKLVQLSTSASLLKTNGQPESKGKIIRFNYAKHGQPNGFILDNGDFIHTKPDGFAFLNLEPGMKVTAKGRAKPLFTGNGQVIEAETVNDIEL
jgi:hypothetical protein